MNAKLSRLSPDTSHARKSLRLILQNSVHEKHYEGSNMKRCAKHIVVAYDEEERVARERHSYGNSRLNYRCGFHGPTKTAVSCSDLWPLRYALWAFIFVYKFQTQRDRDRHALRVIFSVYQLNANAKYACQGNIANRVWIAYRVSR
jgi:hypothetical protein